MSSKQKGYFHSVKVSGEFKGNNIFHRLIFKDVFDMLKP